LTWEYLYGSDICDYAGFIEWDSGLAEIETGIDSIEIDTIVQKFIDDKKVFREGEWLFIPTFTRHQRYKKNNLDAAYKKADELTPKCPRLVSMLLEGTGYPRGTHGVGTGVPPSHPIPSHPIPSQTITKGVIESEDSGPKLGQIESDNAKLVPLANRLIAIITKAEKRLQLKTIHSNDQDKAANCLRLMVGDTFPFSELEAMTKWAFLEADEDTIIFNLQNFRLIHNWRNKWKSGKKAAEDVYEQYQAHIAKLKASGVAPRETPNERAERYAKEEVAREKRRKAADAVKRENTTEGTGEAAIEQMRQRLGVSGHIEAVDQTEAEADVERQWQAGEIKRREVKR
jgi:hypothetical protein